MEQFHQANTLLLSSSLIGILVGKYLPEAYHAYIECSILSFLIFHGCFFLFLNWKKSKNNVAGGRKVYTRENNSPINAQ
jgi:hypothetical protein